MNVGEVTGNVVGGVAGAGLLGMLDGPLPFMDAVGGAVGGAIGGDIGKALGGKGKKRMAGERLELLKALAESPLVGPVSYNPAISTFNPNTQMGGMQGMDAFMGGMQQTHSY